eukprot:6978431-Alexandrium_andersonii.AAC.1
MAGRQSHPAIDARRKADVEDGRDEGQALFEDQSHGNVHLGLFCIQCLRSHFSQLGDEGPLLVEA